MTSNGMGSSTEYIQFLLVLGVISFILLLWHLIRAARAYQRHHDDRAAVGLVIAVGLVVVTAGMTTSSMGLLLEDPVFSVAGLSIARGALLMLALTLVFADVRAPEDRLT